MLNSYSDNNASTSFYTADELVDAVKQIECAIQPKFRYYFHNIRFTGATLRQAIDLFKDDSSVIIVNPRNGRMYYKGKRLSRRQHRQIGKEYG